MDALRVEAEGLTTSFRYPHFLVGRQPTYRMPPPATIYGHICSAVGDFLDPAAVRFGYVFRFAGVGDDLELLHIAGVGAGHLPGTAYPKNLDVTTGPAPREVLLHPHLTLYLAAVGSLLAELERVFREPRYLVTLGRSQDLMAYRSVEVLDLPDAPDAYLEATLLPWQFRLRTRDGVGVTMPRFINPTDRRQVMWDPFITLPERVYTADGTSPQTGLLLRGSTDERWWIDPSTPEHRGMHRGVVWHGFTPTGLEGS